MATSDRPTATSDNYGDTSRPSRWVGARMTLEEFLALPEEKPYLEWDAGVVTQKDMPDDPLLGVVSQKMAPKGDHGSIESEFSFIINVAVRPRRLGRVFTETRFATPGWCPVPDLAYYRAERIKPESRDSFGDFTEPPDIAVEIVSPSQSLSQQLGKCLRYADLGVVVSLVIDPRDRAIYAIRPGQPLQILRDDDPIDLSDVLPDFAPTVGELFDAASPGDLYDASETASGETEDSTSESPAR